MDTLESAARQMWEGDVGALPVVAPDGKLVGIVTDRDACMAAYTQGRRLRDIPVSVAMSKQAWSCRAGDPCSAVQDLMREHQTRRVPVVDSQGKVVGIVSMNDLARRAAAAHGARGAKGDAITSAGVAETLAAICEPRCPLPERAHFEAEPHPLPRRHAADLIVPVGV
jgi:CBS-domain-containing membrane protein